MNPLQIATVATLLNTDPRVVRDVVPVTAGLACAIDDRDEVEVTRLLAPLDKVSLHALVVLLASMVDVEQPLATTRLALEATCQLIVQRAALTFGVAAEDIVSPARTRTIAHARIVAMVVARQAGFGVVDVGRFFQRDHTTVSYAVDKVSREPRLRYAVDAICRELRLDSAAA